ncbi:unnamed protein product [Arabis nemorensis]|uniref:RNase H type-1 domain-containing protein n=1 Tax=Arabis nemorensis TaxID=586526 RepID=A0A565BJ71_9BRAS|nr:unnamed protein product [Arabis nemorensis]
MEIITKAITAAKEWQYAQTLSHNPQASEDQTHSPQTPPQSVTCYVDAAWQANSRCCGLGILFHLDGIKAEHSANRTRLLGSGR